MRIKLLLTFALLLTAVTGAWADDSGSCGTDVSYSYVESTHTLTISGTGAMADYPNPSERPWDSYAGEIETVIIEDGVTGIGIQAFYNCTDLTTVTIGSGVTYIGYDAFYYCPKLEVVYCNANPVTLTWNESGCDDFKEDGSTIIHVADAAPWIEKFTGKVNGIFSDSPYVPFTWNYDAGTKTLTFSGTASIPSYEDPYDRPWKDYVSEVEKIVISDGVMSIGTNAFNDCSGLSSVTIPSSVTSIGMSAFYDCDGLTTVTIPASVTSIGNYAFRSCTGLTSVTIPSSVTSIGYRAFEECESLTSVTVHAPNCTLGEYAFDGCYQLDAIYVLSDKVENYKTAENWSDYADKITAFIGGDCGAEGHEKDVTWVLIGTSLTISGTGAIADYASSENQPWKDYRSSITSVIIESGVTSIGKNAFNNCTGLASVTVDAPDCTLGNGAFEGCSNLEAIYVPSDKVENYKTAENWSDYAIIIMDIKEKIISQGYCGAEGHETDVTWVLKGTSHNYTLTISGTGAMADYDYPSEQPWFSYAGEIETVIIANGVTSIGDYAFEECFGLTTVTIGSGVTYIGNDAFYNCTAVTDVYCYADPAMLTWEENGCDDFKYDGSTIIHVADADPWYTKFGGEVHGIFRDLSTIPLTWNYDADTKTLTFSGTEAIPSYNDLDVRPWIDYVSEVENIVINEGVRGIGKYAFYDCTGLTTVTIPASVKSIGNYAFENCSNLATMMVEAGNTVYDSRNNCNAIIEKSTNTLIAGCKNTKIPDDVTSIGKRAFSGCTGLTIVTIPASVTSIGYVAFAGCSNLATMTVEAGNTVYDSRNGCNAIIEKSTNTLIAGCKNTIIPDDVTNIDDNAFEGCISLTNVTIPAGVTRIGGQAFYNCTGLTTVTIGSGVTYIGYDAFYLCTNVTDVYCYANPDYLCWYDSSCDDFMVGKATECHVTDATEFKEKWSTDDPDVDVNVKFVDDLAPEAETKVAGEEYWSSYYNSATHLKADDNTTVYKATLSGTTVTLTEISDKVITAGQAVLLKKTTNDPVVLTPCADSSEDDYSDNDLEGVDAETAKESGSDYYVLSYQDSKLSFYKYSGATLGANKAFFKIPANSSREFLDILGEVTGIDGRYKMEDGRSDVYYDLNGRRVMNPTKKGVYINNGNKVVVK